MNYDNDMEWEQNNADWEAAMQEDDAQIVDLLEEFDGTDFDDLRSYQSAYESMLSERYSW